MTFLGYSTRRWGMGSSETKIDETAQIGEDVEIGPWTIIGEHVVIESNVGIGPGTIIYPHSIIRNATRVGANCIIGHPTKRELVGVDHSYEDPKLTSFLIEDCAADIGEDGVLRSGTIVYTHTRIDRGLNTGHYAVIREHTTIGEHCVVGSQTVLNGYTKIGDRTRINTACAIPQSMTIGRGVFIAPLVSFSDNERAIPGEGNQGAVIEDFVRIGIGAKILPKIRVGRGALIGAGSVVTKNIPEKAIAYGVPAKIRGYVEDEDLTKYITSIMKWV